MEKSVYSNLSGRAIAVSPATQTEALTQFLQLGINQ